MEKKLDGEGRSNGNGLFIRPKLGYDKLYYIHNSFYNRI